jgi:uncharacterized protein YggE
VAHPIIASSGYVQAEMPSNRASFRAGFKALDRSPQDAGRKAADKVRSLAKSIAAVGSDKARIETSISLQPLYEQYKDKDGRLLTNQRSDKIENYEATASLSIEVRDMSQLERIYAIVLAAGPASTSAIQFRLEPSNEAKTTLFEDAVRDAVRRAKSSAETTGAKLGPIKLIDPTGRACETDVLVAGADRVADDSYPQVQQRPRVYAPPPPPSAPLALPRVEVVAADPSIAGEALKLAVQPPLEKIEAKACVVFALGG